HSSLYDINTIGVPIAEVVNKETIGYNDHSVVEKPKSPIDNERPKSPVDSDCDKIKPSKEDEPHLIGMKSEESDMAQPQPLEKVPQTVKKSDSASSLPSENRVLSQRSASFSITVPNQLFFGESSPNFVR
ncbi:unnamed protein product, partial [Strongylus vulgaris]